MVDVSMGAGGDARLHAHLYRADPHSLVGEIGCGMAPFVDQRMLDILPRVGLADHARHIMSPDGWAANIAKMNPTPQIPRLDAFDIICVPMYDPYCVVLKPLLRHARLLRVPMAGPASIFHMPVEESRPIDVFFIGSVGGYYPMRVLMTRALHAECPTGPNARSSMKFWHGQSPTATEIEAFAADFRLFDVHQRWYADCMRRSKIFPMCGGVGNCPVQKFFEAMACGCLVVAPLPRDADLLGFVDGETMVACDADNFMEKIRYYVDHDAERRRITANAYNLVTRNHSCEARAAILVRQFQEILDGAPAESVDRGLE